MDQEKIGKLISMLRKDKGWTQDELGSKLGISGKSVSKWERGINIPNVSILNDLSNVLGITIDDLLKGSNSCKKFCKFNKKIFLIFSLFGIVSFIFIQNLFSKQMYNLFRDNNGDFNGCVIFSNNKKFLMLEDFDFNTIYESNNQMFSTNLNKFNIELIENKNKDERIVEIDDIKELELILEYLDQKYEYSIIIINLKNQKI